jgi:hypothetical protein
LLLVEFGALPNNDWESFVLSSFNPQNSTTFFNNNSTIAGIMNNSPSINDPSIFSLAGSEISSSDAFSMDFLEITDKRVDKLNAHIRELLTDNSFLISQVEHLRSQLMEKEKVEQRELEELAAKVPSNLDSRDAKRLDTCKSIMQILSSIVFPGQLGPSINSLDLFNGKDVDHMLVEINKVASDIADQKRFDSTTFEKEIEAFKAQLGNCDLEISAVLGKIFEKLNQRRLDQDMQLEKAWSHIKDLESKVLVRDSEGVSLKKEAEACTAN